MSQEIRLFKLIKGNTIIGSVPANNVITVRESAKNIHYVGLDLIHFGPILGKGSINYSAAVEVNRSRKSHRTGLV